MDLSLCPLVVLGFILVCFMGDETNAENDCNVVLWLMAIATFLISVACS